MAIEDPRATQVGGLSGSCIGIDTSAVYAGAFPTGTADAQLNVPVIGGTPSQQIEDPKFAGKALKFQTATGAVIGDGTGVVANTYLNKSGKALVSGQTVLAVAP